MSEDFLNLYGMRILLSGDVIKARQRAQLARVLMFQTKLINTQELDIIRGFRKLDDGTTCEVISQHGLDTAKIYVPPMPIVEGKNNERVETTYLPAFEVFDAPRFGNPVGYVICRSGGWNGAIDFVGLPEIELDHFQYGLLSNRPSDATDSWTEDFLKPKLIVLNEKVNETTTRTIWDIPPTGCQNRVFSCQVSPAEAVRTLTWDYADNDHVCCHVGASLSGGGKPGHRDKNINFILDGHLKQTLGYCITQESFCNDDFYPEDEWETYSYYYNGNNCLDYKPVGTVLPVDGGYVSRQDWANRLMLQGGLYGNEPIICDWGDSDDTCEGIYAYLLAQSYSEPVVPVDVLDWAFMVGNLSGYWYVDNFQNKSYSIRTADIQWTNGTVFDSSSTNSAVDASHYLMVYDRKNSAAHQDWERTWTGDTWYYENSVGYETLGSSVVDSGYIQTDSGTSYCLNYSGDEIDITDAIGDYDDCNPRYFNVGDAEWFLTHIKHHAGDETNNTYFYGFKTPNGLTDVSYVTLEGGDGLLPNITDRDGNPLYTNGQFRLIREDKTIREDI